MGNPDLSGESAGSPSLSELVRSGDVDALAGFRDAHVAKVRAYCSVACPAELVDDASEAAFRDFAGRVCSAPPDAEPELETTLLQATRWAAARHLSSDRPLFPGESSPRRGQRSELQVRLCAAMPELLAAQANGELNNEDEHAVRHHVGSCPDCAAGEARMRSAEAAFLATSPRVPDDARHAD